MHRFALSLLCALVAGALLAAPAPFSGTPWARGWDKPVDPLGDCGFDRTGRTMTLTVPGREDRHTAPQLLRDVEGDFAVEVRVGGWARPGGHRAGLVLTNGQTVVRFERNGEGLPTRTLAIAKPVQVVALFGRGRAFGATSTTRTVHVRLLLEGPPWAKPATLRLERRGSTLRLAYREGGKEWTPLSASHQVALPGKLKVGVVADAAGTTGFKAVFDQFKLTPLGGKTP